MKKIVIAALLSASALTPAAAKAQDLAQVQQMMADMQAELAALRARVAELEAEQSQDEAEQGQMHAQMQQMHTQIVADVAAAQAAAAAAAPSVTSDSPQEISWAGAPEIEGEGGWSFKPRGRLQLDAGNVSAPSAITDASTGFSTEVRRAYLGVEGEMPGGIGYRAEIDIANSSVEITDLYATWQASDQLTLMLGQTKPFWGLEEITSDLNTSLLERAAFNSGFGFERRLGANAVWSSGPVVLQAGLFTDNVADLNNDENNSLSFDARAVFAPRLGDSQLHLGGSVHFRNLNDAGTSVRYRTRPATHTTDLRFLDTGNIAASGENGFGLEAAFISGPFHAAAEWHWQEVEATALASDPTFAGGYLEAGMFLTAGDSRGYRGGVFNRTRPRRTIDEGGPGAWQINVRYDYLDLTDAGVVGGTQNGYLASLVWIPTDYTKLMLNYGRIEYGQAAISAAGDRDYTVDVLGLRAQIDF